MKKTKVIYQVAVFAASALLLTVVNAQTVSEEARRHMARGQAAVETAKSPADLEDAIKEFQKTTELAPEWPDAYYQLGILQDKLGKYDEAWNNLKRCLQLGPQASQAGQIQELIYKIEYKRDKANKKKEIIAILTSGPDNYEKKGGSSGRVCSITNFLQAGEEIKAHIDCHSFAWDQTVPVEFDGSVLKFKYMYYGCPFAPTAKIYPCAEQVSIEAEVISTSPLRFKVKEVWTKTYDNFRTDSYDAEWYFNK